MPKHRLSLVVMLCIESTLFMITTGGLQSVETTDQEKMTDAELVLSLNDPKRRSAVRKTINARLRESGYNEHSDLGKLLLKKWKEEQEDKVKELYFEILRPFQIQEVTDILSEDLRKGSTMVERLMAARRLGMMGSNAVSVLESAISLDQGDFGRDRPIARECIFALGNIGSASVPVLMRIWSDKDRRRGHEETLIISMGISKDNAFVSILSETLEGNNEMIRTKAAWALGEIANEEALTTLKKYQNDSNERVRQNALRLMKKRNVPGGHRDDVPGGDRDGPSMGGVK